MEAKQAAPAPKELSKGNLGLAYSACLKGLKGRPPVKV
jgi:hypothetical protein